MGSTAGQRFAHFEAQSGVTTRYNRHFAFHVDLCDERLYIGVLSRIVGYSSVDHGLS